MYIDTHINSNSCVSKCQLYFILNRLSYLEQKTTFKRLSALKSRYRFILLLNPMSHLTLHQQARQYHKQLAL